MNRETVFVMLGRAGDVINVLPALKLHKERTGQTPFLLVGRDFASILDGVSYAAPLVYDGPWQECRKAIAWAREKIPGAAIVDSSIFGVGYFPITRMASFDREAWDRCETGVPFGRLLPEFDRRDRARERAAWAGVPIDGRKLIVTALAGVSSPYPAGDELRAALANAFPDCKVFDVSGVRCDRLFDLLGILERAAVFVASDSAPLHLAAGVPSLPVVMMTQDAKHVWHRSAWRPNHSARVFYSDAVVDPSVVVGAVRNALIGRRQRFFRVHSYLGTPDVATARRLSVARESWREEMSWSNRWTDLFVDNLPRDSRTLGDPRPCPFSRDLIDVALSRCDRWDDAIVLCNADVGIAPGFTGWLTEALGRSGACFTHRWDSSKPVLRPPLSEGEITTAPWRWYPGSDVWAFTKAWWSTWGDQFPDMVIGREAGDMILRNLIKKSGGVEIPGSIWHEKHDSDWERPGNRETLPSNIRNRLLATTWLRENGGSWNDGSLVRPGLKNRRAVSR